jgi:hypothetical protein
MTLEDLDELQATATWWKGVGHSSRIPIPVNQLTRLIEAARSSAEMSQMEKDAARRHMERHRQARRAA